jgi:hypothetical protein
MAPYSLCPFALVFGQPCPGCGMGRALWACLHGDLAAACTFHPLGPIAFAAAGLVVPLRAMAPYSQRSRQVLTHITTRLHRRATWPIALGVTIGVWLARFGGAFGGPVVVNSPLLSLFDGLFG